MSENRSRVFSTRRNKIVQALVETILSINGMGNFRTDLRNNVYGKLKFFSDITDFPAVCLVAGSEARDYQTNGYKDRYLDIRCIVFVNEENALDKTESILEDIETVIEDNGRLPYLDKDGKIQYTHDITILSISTDEGTLEPISIGEMSLRVQY